MIRERVVGEIGQLLPLAGATVPLSVRSDTCRKLYAQNSALAQIAVLDHKRQLFE